MIEREFRLPLAGLVLLMATLVAMMANNAQTAALLMLGGALLALALFSPTLLAPPALPNPAIRVADANIDRSADRGDLLDHPDFQALIQQDQNPVLGISGERVVMANKAARDLLGQHITGGNIRSAIRHPAALDQIAAQTQDNSSGRAVDLVDLSRPGDRWTMRTAPLPSNRLLIFLSDCSALDAADRMRSDFVANASHELRTPLAAILGYVETLRHMDPDEDDATRQRFLSIIDREANRMQRLVADLLSISRIESDRYRRPTTRIALDVIVRRVVAELLDSGDERARDIAVGRLDDAPLVGDPGQLAQLVHNVLSNSMKYGRMGTPINLSVQCRGGFIRLRVVDFGDGIAQEHLPRLTERFYRVDDARSRAIGGTGLGLAIVKHIVERHRGRLQIDSAPGKGTEVTIFFASGEAQGNADPAAAPAL